MSTVDSGDKDTSTDLGLESPLDFEHSPVGLDGDRRQPFLLTLSFSFTGKSEQS